MSSNNSTLLELANQQDSTFSVLSGYEYIDEKIKFEAGNAYLIGGCEKSGKSAFCMNIAVNLLAKDLSISYVNTEFTPNEFLSRMAGIYLKRPYAEISDSEREEFATKFENKLFYSGIGQNDIVFDSLLSVINQNLSSGVKVIFFDNVTTFSNNPRPGKEGWQEQARAMDELKNLAKGKNVIVFVVCHTKDVPIERTLTSRVKDILDSKDPSRIFDETVTVMAKPTHANLYGGGRVSSQFSGTILIWRPFLKFSDFYFNQTTQIIFESFRNAQAGLEFEAAFHGEIPSFDIFKPQEQQNAEEQENIPNYD